MSDNDYIENVEALYFASGMVDRARDSLEPSAADHKTQTDPFKARFVILYDLVSAALTPEGRTLLDRLVGNDYNSATTTVRISDLYRKFADLAHFCDLVHGAPKFRINERANSAAVQAMGDRLDAFTPEQIANSITQDGTISLPEPPKEDGPQRIGFC